MYVVCTLILQSVTTNVINVNNAKFV